MKKPLLIVLGAVRLVAVSVGATWYVVGGDDETGWSEQEEKDTLDYLQNGSGIYDDKFTEVEAACILEVYERYFPDYDEYDGAADDSPTLLKANAAAGRRCDRR
jgi:hypothetical protein